MIYLVNFFARKIEAVSRQVEMARGVKNNPIITCSYFLGQKPLQFKDIKDNIWVFPKWLYPIVTFAVLIFSESDIHIFEDEPSVWRLVAFNFRKRNIYASLFKDIDPPLVKYLNRIKYLRRVSVEDETSLKFVRKNLKKSVLVSLVYPPALWPLKLSNPITSNRLLFASWNGGSMKDLTERGIYGILRLVKRIKYPCTIVLRDNETSFLNKLTAKMVITNLVKIVFPKNINDLKLEFKKAGYVVIIPRTPVMKDVPNSVIDGFCLGKPCIISANLRFASTVAKNNLGLVFDYDNIDRFVFPNSAKYQKMSRECLSWARKNISQNYYHEIKRLYSRT